MPKQGTISRERQTIKWATQFKIIKKGKGKPERDKERMIKIN